MDFFNNFQQFLWYNKKQMYRFRKDVKNANIY